MKVKIFNSLADATEVESAINKFLDKNKSVMIRYITQTETSCLHDNTEGFYSFTISIFYMDEH